MLDDIEKGSDDGNVGVLVRSPHSEDSVFEPSAEELLSLIADGVVSTDERGRIILFNAAAQEIFDYSEAEVLGQPVEMLLPARLTAVHHREVMAFAKGGTHATKAMGSRREVVGRRSDGSEFPAEASLTRRQVKGRAVMTVVVRDVTARIEIEEQRLLLARETAHRFKNMMAVVNSIVSLSARTAQTKDALERSLRGRLNSLARAHEILLRGRRRCEPA